MLFPSNNHWPVRVARVRLASAVDCPALWADPFNIQFEESCWLDLWFSRSILVKKPGLDGLKQVWLVNASFFFNDVFVGPAGAFTTKVRQELVEATCFAERRGRTRFTAAFIFNQPTQVHYLVGFSWWNPTTEKFYSRKVGSLYALSRAVAPISKLDAVALKDQAVMAYKEAREQHLSMLAGREKAKRSS